jgi:predicted RNA binding protein with dsRBD fold (UPF0201 family)
MPEFRLRVTLESSVAPSEDPKKVLAAMESVVGDCPHITSESARQIRIESEDPGCLLRIHDQLRDRHVRGAARRLLLVGRRGETTTVMLNRQAAAVGVIALCGSEGESALGPIYLMIQSREIDAVTEWLTSIENRVS